MSEETHNCPECSSEDVTEMECSICDGTDTECPDCKGCGHIIECNECFFLGACEDDE